MIENVVLIIIALILLTVFFSRSMRNSDIPRFILMVFITMITLSDFILGIPAAID